MKNIISKTVKFLRKRVRELFNLEIKRIVYYPIIDNKNELSYLVNNIASTIPFRDNLVIHLFVTNDLANENFSNLEIPNFQGNFIQSKDLRHIKLANYRTTELFKADLICLTDTNHSNKLFFWKYKIENLDVKVKNNGTAPDFYKTINWLVNNNTKNNINLDKSRQNYLRLLSEKKGSERSIVVAGGPSIKKYMDFKYKQDDFVISINDYVIKDLEFFDYINMDAVCFSDPVLFFGASKYTQEFYDKLITAFQHKKFYIFVDVKCFDILDSYNIFDGYIVGIKMERCKWYQLLNPNEMVLSVYPLANSLTRYAGSIGLSISDTVLFLGADGMKKNDMKIINKNYSDTRTHAYNNYNMDLPLIYRTYKTSLKHHNNYNLYLNQFIDFALTQNKEVYTLVESNYESLQNLVWKEHQ